MTVFNVAAAAAASTSSYCCLLLLHTAARLQLHGCAVPWLRSGTHDHVSCCTCNGLAALPDPHGPQVADARHAPSSFDGLGHEHPCSVARTGRLLAAQRLVHVLVVAVIPLLTSGSGLGCPARFEVKIWSASMPDTVKIGTGPVVDHFKPATTSMLDLSSVASAGPAGPTAPYSFRRL